MKLEEILFLAFVGIILGIIYVLLSIIDKQKGEITKLKNKKVPQENKTIPAIIQDTKRIEQLKDGIRQLLNYTLKSKKNEVDKIIQELEV